MVYLNPIIAWIRKIKQDTLLRKEEIIYVPSKVAFLSPAGLVGRGDRFA